LHQLQYADKNDLTCNVQAEISEVFKTVWFASRDGFRGQKKDFVIGVDSGSGRSMYS